MYRRHVLGAALIITLAIVTLAQPVAARHTDQPPPQAGWVHGAGYIASTSAGHGLPLSGQLINFSSPVIADIDSNPSNGKEVVVGGRDGRVHALSVGGTELWQRTVPAGCTTDKSLIFGKPTVGAIFGNGVPYVVVGFGTRGEDSNCDGGVIVYRGSDGQPAWTFSLKGYDPSTPEGPENQHGVITSVALADVEGDGQMELAFGGIDRTLYLLNANGTVRWTYHAADSVWATPLFMNVDGDTQLELVAGTDITGNKDIIPPTTDGGFVYAFDTAPRSPSHMPFQSGYLWRTFFDQVIYSSPLAADLLPDSAGLEIAVGAGCFWPDPGTVKRGNWVKILRPSDGVVLQTLNAPGCTQSSPAVGDIDEDGANEIVIIATGAGNGGDGLSRIVAWDPESATPKWQAIPYSPHTAPQFTGAHDASSDMQSPVIADLDGNGSLEVLASNFWSVHIMAGKTGAFLSCQNEQCGSQMSLFGWGQLKATPAVSDMDNDGDLEVVIGGMNDFAPDKTAAHVYAWTNFAGILNSAPGTKAAYSAPWPEFRRTATADGVFAEPGLVTTVKALQVVLKADQTRSYVIAIGTADGGPISPTVQELSDISSIVTESVSERTLSLTVNTAGLASGTYSATIEINSAGLPAITIPVSIVVVDSLTTSNLPLVIR